MRRATSASLLSRRVALSTLPTTTRVLLPLCSQPLISTSSYMTQKATKAKKLRDMLQSKDLEFIMEAHNGLSAKIVEETGFKGIWASGLSISAAMGVRDSNEASYTQVLEVLEFMSDNTSIPILLDGDTGYGNFNNARRLVRKLEQRGIAGVCLEDKLFPKTNSLLDDVSQPLADQEEFCGKIRACKDSQQDPNFSVVARCEGFIAGWGLDFMLTRAEAYAKAGADAVLVHSKRGDPQEIEAFMKEWNKRGQPCPVVIVPTKYYKTPTQKFKDWGISLVIWANHNLRSCITAMQQTSKQIFEEQSLVNVEPRIATVNEVFRLQNEKELQEAEKKYLPKGK
jgi:phosphoenolpyruvate phosphomutase